jgi:hypothetical protein
MTDKHRIPDGLAGDLMLALRSFHVVDRIRDRLHHRLDRAHRKEEKTMNITDTTPNDRFKMIVESDGNAIHDIAFVTESGERWTAHDPNAEIYQREDGKWMVGWQLGAAGPFESSQFAQAVADAMREGAIEPEKPLLS